MWKEVHQTYAKAAGKCRVSTWTCNNSFHTEYQHSYRWPVKVMVADKQDLALALTTEYPITPELDERKTRHWQPVCKAASEPNGSSNLFYDDCDFYICTVVS